MRKTSRFFKLGEASKEDENIAELILGSAAPPLKMQFMAYGPNDLEETTINSAILLSKRLANHPVNWINIESTTLQAVQPLAELFNLHELALEDALKSHQRSKIDNYPDHLFIVLRVPTGKGSSCDTEQLSLFLGKNYLISFQEKTGGDCLESVRDRLRKSLGTIRSMGADHLAYAIIDAGVDAYFPILEHLGEHIEKLEESIVGNTSEHTPAQIHELKLQVLAVRRSVWPMRDTINTLCRDLSPYINEGTRVYFRDCYDHISRIIDLVEMFRELSTDLLNIYLSSVNNRMNEIIKVLTIMTSLFIPPTLIAGIYGMNFKNIPELNIPCGYQLCLFFMFISSMAMLFYLRHRKWM